MTVLRKELFDLPEGVVYLDGNSLGPLPRAARARLLETVEREWGGMLIRAWNEAGWMEQPRRVGDAIGRLIGAPAGSVVCGDTLTIKVFQALDAALSLRPGRKVVLSDTGNFPSDLYVARALIKRLAPERELRTVAPEEVEAAIAEIGEDLAVLMLTEVDYRTGRRHDMGALTAAAQAVGAVTVWDLAHSAGAVDVDLAACGAEFAVGCTYKYLNGGPGAPAFIHVRPDLAERVEPVLAGWLGHAAPFAFEPDYRPGAGIERMRVGTPAVLQMAVLEAALTVWEGIAPAELRASSLALTEQFIDEVELRCPELRLASPREPARRGSQVSFAHPEGYAVMRALIDRGVIGDFRAPDLMRFGFAPLYNDAGDVARAAEVLAEVLATRAWDRPEYRRRARVT